jgi:hypothetical protein
LPAAEDLAQHLAEAIRWRAWERARAPGDEAVGTHEHRFIGR